MWGIKATAMNIVQRYLSGQKVNMDQLKSVSLDDLLELKIQVDADIAGIGGQLDRAKESARLYKSYADPSWFTSAIRAKRIKGVLSQTIQTVLGQRKRVQDEERRKSFEGRVIIAMRERLDPEVVSAILVRTKELA